MLSYDFMHITHKILQLGFANSPDSGHFEIQLLRENMHSAHIFIEGDMVMPDGAQAPGSFRKPQAADFTIKRVSLQTMPRALTCKPMAADAQVQQRTYPLTLQCNCYAQRRSRADREWTDARRESALPSVH